MYYAGFEDKATNTLKQRYKTVVDEDIATGNEDRGRDTLKLYNNTVVDKDRATDTLKQYNAVVQENIKQQFFNEDRATDILR